ncbi:hypothetical protein GQR60_10355 [Labilibaculum sp. A4]|uniref:Spy/CpxP family protein refolding chaperone n=1 Tax=Labilibaculum euxinus TaxID=2686357 RepID=UPI000F617DAF|nr:hypothetical protein [Labilibaculum euxinus]MDQ1772677.1 hypothetical protein [Labilibaculum euxinus]MWN76745.1 hypothetical protein [Labilibaculum euxinus]
MKTQNLVRNLGLLLMVIMFTIPAADSFAQNRRRANDCSQISNLTVEQNKQLNDLRADHLKVMDALRAERRAAVSNSDRANVREKMQAELSKHTNAVSAVLTPEQRVQYLQNRNSNAQYISGKGRRGRACGNGCGQGRRGRGGQGRGNW